MENQEGRGTETFVDRGKEITDLIRNLEGRKRLKYHSCHEIFQMHLDVCHFYYGSNVEETKEIIVELIKDYKKFEEASSGKYSGN